LSKKEIDSRISKLPRIIHVAQETLDEVALMMRAERKNHAERKGAITKESHQSIQTVMDIEAQNIILQEMRNEFPEMLIITEEEVGINFENSLATEKDISEGKLIMVIDPLDGTAQYFSGLDQFSVSLGIIENGKYVGGVICSPVFGGGFTVYGTINEGSFVKHGGIDSVARVSHKKGEINQSVILYGVDLPRRKNLYNLLNRVSIQSLVANSMGSCALGLAMLAIGKVDGFVQSLQYPWDWAAGYPLLLGAGGYISFYEIGLEGEIIIVERPNPKYMVKKGKEFGFVAANSLALLEQLQEMLVGE